MKVRPFYLVVFFLLLLLGVELTYTQLIFSAERSLFVMDTPVMIKIYGRNAPILSWWGVWKLKQIDRLLSKYDPDSEISMVNKLAGKTPIEVSPETMECLRLAQKINDISSGAFDVTLGYPYLLVLDTDKRKVFIERKGVAVDLGGIGKGYGAEVVRRLLLKKGAKSGMIDMRSSIAVFGRREWVVGVQDPRDKDKLLGTVILRDGQSLATSGNYERGEHIVDARIRYPARKCLGATIIGKNAAVTDAVATAVFVLGPDQGMQFIESQPGIEGLIVDREGKIIQSSGFELSEI